jgi:hypothetical protein
MKYLLALFAIFLLTAPQAHAAIKFIFDANSSVKSDSFSFPGGPISVAFWSRPPDNTFGVSAFTIGNDNTNRDQAHFPWSDTNIYWDYGNFGTGRLAMSLTPYFYKLTHFVLTSNGVNAMQIYANGVLVASSGTAANPPAQTGLWIGAYPVGGLGYSGTLQNFAVYNRVIGPNEVRALYQGAPPPQNGLVGYWPLYGNGGRELDFSTGRHPTTPIGFTSHSRASGAPTVMPW